MHISIEHFNDQFNVALASKEGKEPFITIKGCRIVDGTKGRFVSWPARKQDNGKWWSHVWASTQFSDAVVAEYDKSAKPAKSAPPRRPARQDDMDDDIPF